MKKSITASLLVLAALAPVASFASDGTISFNGAVSGRTCIINGNAPNFSVTLPKVSSAAISTAGKGFAQESSRTQFDISLTACAGVNGARAFFESGSNVESHGYLINTGTAPYVVVALTRPDGSGINPGVAGNGGNYVPINNGAATLSYAAFYFNYRGNTTVAPGTVTASVGYSIEYQ